MPRAPILLLLSGLLLVAAAYLLTFAGDTALAPWALALGATTVLSAMLWLGGRRAGRLPRRLAVGVVVAAISTFGGFAVALTLAPTDPSTPLLLGIPRPTTLLLLCTGAVPLIVLPLIYALAFDDEVVGPDKEGAE